jgi:hypothetical protein
MTDVDNGQALPDWMRGVPQRPSGWRYGWLGNSGVQRTVLPIPVPPGWKPSPLGEVAPSPLHVHDAGCWGDDSEAIMDNLEGVGWVCNVTARWPTTFGENEAGARIVLRYDPWVWYPMDVVERTRG